MPAVALSPIHRVKRIARVMKYVIGAGMLVCAVCPFAIWGLPALRTQLFYSLNLSPDQVALPQAAIIGGFLLSSVFFAVMCLALFRALSLFRCYERGEVFSLAAITHIRAFAMGLLSLGLLAPVLRTLLVLDLTLGHPTGQNLRILSIGISQADYLLVVFGGLLLAVSWVMVEAARAVEENREIV